jgi:O-acetyl-ADP-ribose deacetylase (regulator of RNase III)
MIEPKRGNILEADAEALVNTVNSVGVMGKGIALQFKKAFPENYETYRKAAKRGEVYPGRMFIYATGRMVNPKFKSIFQRSAIGTSHRALKTSGSDFLP